MEDIKEETNTECQELKNIKYKTMLLNGSILIETKSSNDLSNLDTFLNEEMKNNEAEPWCKLNKTIKIQKMIEFVENYTTENVLNHEESQLLINFLKDCLDKKKLLRVKDVVYDKIKGSITEIPSLVYNKPVKHFTLKNMDKQRVSTLKSLSVKKSNCTIRNKMIDTSINVNEINITN